MVYSLVNIQDFLYIHKWIYRKSSYIMKLPISDYHCNAESNSHVNIFFLFICKESTGIGAYIPSNTSNWTVRHISKYLTRSSKLNSTSISSTLADAGHQMFSHTSQGPPTTYVQLILYNFLWYITSKHGSGTSRSQTVICFALNTGLQTDFLHHVA